MKGAPLDATSGLSNWLTRYRHPAPQRGCLSPSDCLSEAVVLSTKAQADLAKEQNDGEEEGGEDNAEEEPAVRLEKTPKSLAEDLPHIRVHRIQILENESEQPLEEEQHGA